MTTYLVLLSVIGGLGVAAWLWTIRAVGTGKRWARPAAMAMLAAGATIALTELLTKDTSGDTGLPMALGWAGLAPPAAGLAAVLLLRSPQRAR